MPDNPSPEPKTPKRQGRYRPNDMLIPIGPAFREIFARWMELRAKGFEKALNDLSIACANGCEPAGSYNQALYWRTAMQVIAKLAWDIRTAKGGPLAGQARRRRKIEETEQG